MKIGVCCSACRSETLPYVIHCFEKQTYENKYLIILDDENLFPECRGEQWEVQHITKCSSLGQKRNICAAMQNNCDALVVWDDDDIYFPWALEATARALEVADWSRPSQFCWWNDRLKKLVPAKTYGRDDKRDKAFQCAWGVRTKSFFRAGGYDPSLSVGEDMRLALALENIGVTECDPIEDLNYKPWYVWGPFNNSHVSDPKHRFGHLSGEPSTTLLSVPPPSIDLDNPVYLNNKPIDRGFKKKDWYEDATR